MPYLLLLLVALFWSGNFIVARSIQDYIPPFSLSFIRWALALLLLIPFSARSFFKQKDQLQGCWKIILLLGILGIACFSTFVYIALHSTTVTNTVLINATNPVFIVIFSWIGYKDRVSVVQIAGIVLSIGGVLWIIARGNPSFLINLQFAKGDLWPLAAAVCWALYTVLLRQYPGRTDSVAFLTALFMAGLIFLTPLYLWEYFTETIISVNVASVSGGLYLGIFPSIFAYIFWNRGVKTVGANKAGVFVYLIPVFSIVLAFLLFDERFKSYHPPGVFLIALGIFLTTYFGKKRTP
ncbi:MAG: DMT family transporter [Thermodesulfobacteriota bacterium]